MNRDEMWAKNGVSAETDATVAAWIIQAPWAHPVWHSYWLHVIHLRPLAGGDIGPSVYVPGATHELWLYALNPDADPETVARECKPAQHFLTPINFAAQLVLPDDAGAVDLAAGTARDVLKGLLNPDTDARSQWIERFGDAMVIA